MSMFTVFCIGLAITLRLVTYRTELLALLGGLRLRLEAGKGASEETKLILIALAALAILAAFILPAIIAGSQRAASEITGP